MSEKIASGFDRLAASYDGLAAVVSGNQIKKSQVHFLHRIPDGSRILMLGGGTGWLLPNMLTDKFACELWYIDISARMIKEASARHIGNNKVHFIRGTDADIPVNIKFDIVITNFYLDLFSEREVERIVRKIIPLLSHGAVWIATDFVDQGKWWQKVLLQLMYHFFRSTCGIEARSLPGWVRIMSAHMRRSESECFLSGFIISAVYLFPGIDKSKFAPSLLLSFHRGIF